MANRDRIYKHSSELMKAQTYESDLKKMKDPLAAEIKKQEASDDLAAKSSIKIDAAKEKMNAAM